MAVAQDLTTGGGAKTTALLGTAIAAGNQTITPANRLQQILVTTANGANAISIFDGSTSGTIVAIVPASAAIGTIIRCNMPILTGSIVVGQTAAAGNLTISYN